MGWFNFVDKISSKLAFFPPQPPTYELLSQPDGARELYLQPTGPEYRRVLNCAVNQIKTKNGHTIVTAFFKSPTKAKCTLLYSHGNAVDLGQMLPFFRWASAWRGDRSYQEACQNGAMVACMSSLETFHDAAVAKTPVSFIH